MPRDPAGNFTLVPSYRAESGQTIRTEQHNPPLEDIASSLTNSLPRDGRGGMVGPLDMGSFPIKNVAPGVSDSDVATVGQGLPIGSIVAWPSNRAPAGWFFCFGQELSRTDYPRLLQVIETTYGGGPSTFRLPDLRGRVIAGRDDMGGADAGRLSGFYGSVGRTTGGSLGAPSHTLSVAQMPSHNHRGITDTKGQHNHGGVTAGGGIHSHTAEISAVGDHAHGISTNNNAAAGSAGVRAGNTPASGVTQNTEPAGGHTHNLRIDAVGNHNHEIFGDGAHSHFFETTPAGNGEPSPIAQPTFILNYIIKAV